ncbi:MAG: hypothetical protein KBC22_02045 [Candidatus Pacebacteria bacterium]|nr:hypothetical protein [Candidatus Paceibacterota bacterium]
MNKKTGAIVGGIIILVIFLLVVGNKKTNQVVVSDTGAEIPCLPRGHQQVAQHIHPNLSIIVDGVPEEIPADIGIEGACMREIHTHDTSGTIHIETAKLGTVYLLEDFFTVWNQPIERPGYNLVVTQDGEIVDPENLVLVDHAAIVLQYTSIE